MEVKITFAENEKFFGLAVNEGIHMPLDKNSTYCLDLREYHSGNQASSVLLSNKGRYVYSNEPFKLMANNGEIILERLNSKRFTRIASWDVSDKRSLVSLDIVDPNNNYNTMRLQFDNETGDIYKFFYNGADQTWVFKSRYCQTTVADIPLTTITTFLNENIRGKVCYSVRNGICYVSIQDLISSVEQYRVNICALPKPYDYSAFQYVTCVNNATDNRNTRNSIYIDNYEGVLTGHFTNTIANWASFSYPVAES